MADFRFIVTNKRLHFEGSKTLGLKVRSLRWPFPETPRNDDSRARRTESLRTRDKAFNLPECLQVNTIFSVNLSLSSISNIHCGLRCFSVIAVHGAPSERSLISCRKKRFQMACSLMGPAMLRPRRRCGCQLSACKKSNLRK